MIKEKLCSIGYDIEQEQKLALETTVLVESYTLPDGHVIRVGGERFEAPEELLQPHLVNVEGVCVAELLFSTGIISCVVGVHFEDSRGRSLIVDLKQNPAGLLRG